MKTMLLGMIWLLFVVHSSWACYCPPITLQETFCFRNRFVIKAHIERKIGPLLRGESGPIKAVENDTRLAHGYMLYKLQIEQIYKDVNGLNSSIIVLKSPLAMSLCAVELANNTTYILTGGIGRENGAVVRYTNGCDIHTTSTNFEVPNCNDVTTMRMFPMQPQFERRGEKEMAQEELQLQERDPDPFFGMLGLVSDED